MQVLIVDDSRSMRMLIRRCMRQAGFGEVEVEEACDGVEGLQKLKQAQPDVVLSDWNMPGMGGEEFARQALSSYSGLTFGFITSEASADIRERAKSVGARFLLTKPFDAASMAAVLGPCFGAA